MQENYLFFQKITFLSFFCQVIMTVDFRWRLCFTILWIYLFFQPLYFELNWKTLRRTKAVTCVRVFLKVWHIYSYDGKKQHTGRGS